AQTSSLVRINKKTKNFEYWFYQRLMGKIHNVFIKQHQRGRWRYLSLLAQSVGTRFPACAQFHKKHLTNSPHII
ncbi:TPA: hypothetical protein ACUM1W_001819, partial [Haemophilus influenzae]